ncbi:SDR family NAD(P)-dependent oxidoreductase [Gordonia terrae]|uniref:SDR family NAD(P)-dependent oxidoreductase n=2 Tax=Gordonia terrae TaxID=2055 RepID=A0AAD0KCR1_9ACTN|nr:SDR family oxidoreductase [Gordonia terrae]VTR10819.1 short-chain dehydrogenase/reductase SDR [Clostridioides difficile]ANY24382.1 short-chain dehydrogenase [Gordonia terrae]AWO85129.1 SDR family NAD(P)-dependent oxidoreductase [Gordonia terrae]VTS58714.1 D-beta-hydroxybutyrate dehydrogenase [Gordonia terrae]GAB46760.1 putative oxidoreductase [Gordonia terrae NBRC 100016]
MSRTALVTGASRGIGLEIARRFASAGWDLTVSARTESTLAEATDSLRAESASEVSAVVADMASEEDVSRLAAAHRDRFGRLDALVLNAGMGSIGPFDEFPVRRLDKLLTVNVRSAYLLIQQLLPLLRATAGDAGSSRVIAISSLTGTASEPLNSAYGASKAALTSLCETLNTEESLGGVSATALCPGYVATDMTAPLTGEVPADTMIDPVEIAELAVGLTRLGRSAVIPAIFISRPGPLVWRV